MPNSFLDPTTPRYQLPIEQLPRGFVPFPDCIVEFFEKEQARMGFRFSEEYLWDSLERNTLVYYYEHLPVAYHSADGGVEVLAVGWEETLPYLKDPSVKVIQP
jgi:hypothetical protein